MTAATLANWCPGTSRWTPSPVYKSLNLDGNSVTLLISYFLTWAKLRHWFVGRTISSPHPPHPNFHAKESFPWHEFAPRLPITNHMISPTYTFILSFVGYLPIKPDLSAALIRKIAWFRSLKWFLFKSNWKPLVLFFFPPVKIWSKENFGKMSKTEQHEIFTS